MLQGPLKHSSYRNGLGSQFHGFRQGYSIENDFTKAAPTVIDFPKT